MPVAIFQWQRMLALFWIHFTLFRQSWVVSIFHFHFLRSMTLTQSWQINFLFNVHCSQVCYQSIYSIPTVPEDFWICDIFDWIESICFMWIWEGPEYWSCKSLRTFMSFPYIDPNPEGQTERMSQRKFCWFWAMKNWMQNT